MNEVNLKQFYKELGRVLYSIADTDGKIRRQEKDAVREFIIKEILPFEKTADSSGMNQSFYALFEFEELQEKDMIADLVFLKFINYLKANQDILTQERKKWIIESVKKVADSFHNTNKKEAELIDNLEVYLNSLN